MCLRESNKNPSRSTRLGVLLTWMNPMETYGWCLPPWAGWPWYGAPQAQLVAEWLEFLTLVEGFYARRAAECGLSVAPLRDGERRAAAALAAATGIRPALALARLVDWWA